MFDSFQVGQISQVFDSTHRLLNKVIKYITMAAALSWLYCSCADSDFGDALGEAAN